MWPNATPEPNLQFSMGMKGTIIQFQVNIGVVLTKAGRPQAASPNELVA
jgi:hypothetical protein